MTKISKILRTPGILLILYEPLVIGFTVPYALLHLICNYECDFGLYFLLELFGNYSHAMLLSIFCLIILN